MAAADRKLPRPYLYTNTNCFCSQFPILCQEGYHIDQQLCCHTPLRTKLYGCCWRVRTLKVIRLTVTDSLKASTLGSMATHLPPFPKTFLPSLTCSRTRVSPGAFTKRICHTRASKGLLGSTNRMVPMTTFGSTT
jgi:hypothetical protein